MGSHCTEPAAIDIYLHYISRVEFVEGIGYKLWAMGDSLDSRHVRRELFRATSGRKSCYVEEKTCLTHERESNQLGRESCENITECASKRVAQENDQIHLEQ